MATDPVPDPIDEEIRQVLADPDVQASLETYRSRRDRGEGPAESNDEDARRIVGLPPSATSEEQP